MNKILIATRKSPLALVQSEMVGAWIKARLGVETELLKIVTTGDAQAKWSLEKRVGSDLVKTVACVCTVKGSQGDYAGSITIDKCVELGPMKTAQR